jgi:hypothetical protein
VKGFHATGGVRRKQANLPKKDVDTGRGSGKISSVQVLGRQAVVCRRRLTKLWFRRLNMKKLFLKALGIGIVLSSAAGVRGDVLYDNTTTDTSSFLTFPSGQQIGEQIWLGTLTPEYLTNFSFVYYSPDANWTETVNADVRFYENDGTPTNGFATPSTLFYDSGLISFPNPIASNGGITASNSLNAIFELSDLQSLAPGVTPLDPNMVLPTNFTFTVTFTGLTGGDSVGLPIYQPPTVGTNYGDYWYDVSGTWELLTNTTPVAFGAQFNGSPEPTPEPTVLCLGALGVAAMAAMARRRQQRG